MAFLGDYSDVRGFMYEPSYAWSEVEAWQHFDPEIIELELGRGKDYFPRMNAVRMCVSFEAFKREPEKLLANFGKLLDIAESYNLAVMPMLFNRWHNALQDFGGIYLDHFYIGEGPCDDEWFTPYVQELVGTYAKDPRILMWDICNEPLPPRHQANAAIRDAELKWLEDVYVSCKNAGAIAPLCVGLRGVNGVEQLQLVDGISDVMTVHAYKGPNTGYEAFQQEIGEYAEVAEEKGKPLLVTETCYGAATDEARRDEVRDTLGALKSRRIGWFAVMLHWSVRIDCHGEENGLPVGPMGNLAFINRDGSLRKGHEVFNEY